MDCKRSEDGRQRKERRCGCKAEDAGEEARALRRSGEGERGERRWGGERERGAGEKGRALPSAKLKEGRSTWSLTLARSSFPFAFLSSLSLFSLSLPRAAALALFRLWVYARSEAVVL